MKNKITNYFKLSSFAQLLYRINYTFGEKRKVIYDFFYITLYWNFYQKIAGYILLFILNKLGYIFYSEKNYLRLILFSGIRTISIENIFKIRNNHFKSFEDNVIEDPVYEKIILEIREKGFCDITKLINISDEDIENVIAHYKANKFYDGHDPMQSSFKKMNYNELKSDHLSSSVNEKGYYSPSIQISLKNSVIHKLYNNIHFQKISSLYCGYDTEFCLLHTMLNIKNPGSHSIVQSHRDQNDFIELGFFIYWTDTDKNNGATTYQEGSHRNLEKNLKNYSIEVPRGSVIAGDFMGIHKGNDKLESSEERFLTVMRFGKKINQGYMRGKMYYFM